jgi:hypothetical protein
MEATVLPEFKLPPRQVRAAIQAYIGDTVPETITDLLCYLGFEASSTYDEKTGYKYVIFNATETEIDDFFGGFEDE